MKIGLLIFPLHYSHGNILQTYALYSKLKELGHDVIILDRQPNKQSTARWYLAVLKRLAKWLFKGYKGAIFYKGWFPKKIMEEQQPFIDSIKKDIITIWSSDELRQIVVKEGFKAIVVGSDQTWRPRYVPNVMDYWLDFASDMNVFRVAYAPSFGVDVWEYDENQTRHCKELSSLFAGISVREESGVKLCKENLDIDVSHVLDPTMLWNKSFYEPIARNYTYPKGLCQCYFLDRTPEKEQIANRIASFKNLTVNYVNTRTEDSDSPVKGRVAPSLEKWLAGFLYGDFIVVDSFHAMIFSIIFQKPFVVVGNINRGISRFESLLEDLNLKKRLLSSSTALDDVINDKINWIGVETKLALRRKESLSFLMKALSQ